LSRKRMDELSSKERLLRALQLKIPDRVPVTTFFNLFPAATELSDYPMPDMLSEPSYQRLYRYAVRHSDFLQRYFFDGYVRRFFTEVGEDQYRHMHRMDKKETILITPKGKLVNYVKKSRTSTEKKAFLENEKDIDKALSIPYRDVRPDLTDFFRSREQLGNKGLMVAQIYNPLSCLYFNSKLEQYAIWLITEKRRVRRFLEAMFDRIYSFLEYLLGSGVGPVFLIVGSEFATPPMVAPAMFRELVAKYDKKLIELIHKHNCFAVIHCHGRIKEVLGSIEFMGPDGLHPVESPPMGDCSLAEAKIHLGNKVCLIGNIQIDALRRSERSQIDKFCRQTIKEAAKDGGFILSPTTALYGKTISKRVTDNYIQFINSARLYGKYPLEHTT